MIGFGTVEGDAASVLLVTFSQLGLVFLGLYFTAVSVVIGTAYADAPGEVRSLMARDRASSLYSSLITFFTVLTLVQLALGTFLGADLGSFNLALVSTLAILTTISFVILATRSFDFFDPTALGEFVVRDLARWMSLASRRGLHWRDPSFQAHYQRRAEESVRLLRLLTEFVIAQRTSVRSTALRDVSRDALRALLHYVAIKSEIPTDSRWFKRTAIHRDWLPDYSAVEIAIATSTNVSPDLVPDPQWLEAGIRDVMADALQTAVSRRDAQNTLAIGQAVAWGSTWTSARSSRFPAGHEPGRGLPAEAA